MCSKGRYRAGLCRLDMPARRWNTESLRLQLNYYLSIKNNEAFEIPAQFNSNFLVIYWNILLKKWCRVDFICCFTWNVLGINSQLSLLEKLFFVDWLTEDQRNKTFDHPEKTTVFLWSWMSGVHSLVRVCRDTGFPPRLHNFSSSGQHGHTVSTKTRTGLLKESTNLAICSSIMGN